MGERGNLYSGDRLFQRAGETARRDRAGNAGALSVAEALGGAVGKVPRVRLYQAPSLQPLELDRKRELGRRAVGCKRPRRWALWACLTHPRNHGQSGFSFLAPL